MQIPSAAHRAGLLALRAALWRLAAGLLLAAVGLFPGFTYSDRLSDHRGFYLISVADRLGVAPPAGPRRAVVVVLDGLGHAEAEQMAVTRTLRALGQCRVTDVGSLSLSRPVYAVLSTGLEADRTGCRDNFTSSPLRAESIWSIARAAGRSVSGVSELPWFAELFPQGFSSYRELPRRADFFLQAQPADLMLIHTLYIDEAGHEAGAASPRYHEAVARADRELGGLLPTLDLRRDLLVVTADHGHALRGGHGGRQERVAHVLTCFAGFGVEHRSGLGEMRTTSLAPSLALLMGLRFPAQMRADGDDLNVLFDIADPAAYPAAYLADRVQSVTRYQKANRDQLRRWYGVPGWDAFYRRHQRRQAWGLAAVVAAALAAGGLLGWHKRWRSRGLGLGWMISIGAALWGLQVGLCGSFDLSSVRDRPSFISFTVALGLSVGIAAGLLHLRLRRSLPALVADAAGLLGGAAVLCLGHPLVYGWIVRAPIPGPAMYFFPYFSCLVLASLVGLAALLLAESSRRMRRADDTFSSWLEVI